MNIAVSYPYIGAITKSIGGEHINTVVLAKGNWTRTLWFLVLRLSQK